MSEKEIIKKSSENYTPIAQTKAGGLTYTKKDIDDKFNTVNFLLFGVVVILLVMVATLIIDSFHINSATYKEYSDRIKSVDATQQINEELLKQVRENQEIIKSLLKK